MNLLALSWKNITAKPLSTLMSLILFALGVGMVSLLLLLNKQLEDKFEKNLAKINLVVGAKGSPMQLILSSIYHIDFPTGNISLKEANFVKKNPLVRKTIPLAMGDSYKFFRIIGTNHDYPTLYETELSEGKLWEKDFEVTLGAKVAKDLGLKLGDQFVSAHGFGEAIMQHEQHKFVVAGILKPSKTVIDQLILTNIASIWKSHDHGANDDHNHEGHDHEEGHDHDHAHDKKDTPQAEDLDKEITSLLVFFRNPIAAIQLPRLINDKTDMQAAAPAFEISRLNEMMGVGQRALRALALVIILVSGFSVFISLFNSLRERRYELAIMRVMGGSRGKLFALVILEGLIIAVLGFVLGILLSHGAMEVLAYYMQESYQYEFTGKTFMKEEWWLLVGSLLVGLVAAVLPAIQASMTDISKTLSGN